MKIKERNEQYTYFPFFLRKATKKLRIWKLGKELKDVVMISFEKDFVWTREILWSRFEVYNLLENRECSKINFNSLDQRNILVEGCFNEICPDLIKIWKDKNKLLRTEIFNFHSLTPTSFSLWQEIKLWSDCLILWTQEKN